ncbi:hypothetical protein QS257_15010 [Terrilactibacillus sp. S3-3]|nr:hypothetical protein QS257_15010 [Terrilactibacillus sp. S3-3]
MDIQNGMLLGNFKAPAASSRNVAFGLYNEKTRTMKKVKTDTETNDHSIVFKLPLHLLPLFGKEQGVNHYDCFVIIKNKAYRVEIGAEKVKNRLLYMDERAVFTPSDDTLALFTVKAKRLILVHGNPFLAFRAAGRCFRGRKITIQPRFSDGRLILTTEKPLKKKSDDLRFRTNQQRAGITDSFSGRVTDDGNIAFDDLDRSILNEAAGSDLFLDVRRGLTLISFPVMLHTSEPAENAGEKKKY